MKFSLVLTIFSGVVLVANDVFGASLLKNQSFPKTFNDLTFSQKNAVLSEGYEPWETEYDKSTGRCISNCAYQGITMQEQLENIERNTINAANQLLASGYSVNENGSFVAPAGSANTNNNISNANTQSQNIIVSSLKRCSPSHPDIPVGQTRPIGEPLVGKPKITSGYGSRIHPVTGNNSVHAGVDFAAALGTSVFSPASGTVVSVWTDSTCGKGLKIRHSDGYETVYCHLSQHLVSNGDKVEAGCEVAKTGNTGRSTGPHLHYAIKHNNGKKYDYIDPTQWLGR